MIADEVRTHPPLLPCVFNSISPPVNAKLGFGGYVIDFVNRPHNIRRFLMRLTALYSSSRAFIVRILSTFVQAIVLRTSRLDS